MISLDCNNCGKCCYSKKPETEELILQEPKDHRENLVILTHDEVKKFWLEGFGSLLFIARLYKKEDKTIIKIGLRNFVKGTFVICPFLDDNKKCMIYKTELYPLSCRSYPYINLLYNKSTKCEERINGSMDKTEADKAKKYFEMARLNDSFGIDEDFDSFKEIITNRGPFLVCQKLLQNLFGEPKEPKQKNKEIMKIIQKEYNV